MVFGTRCLNIATCWPTDLLFLGIERPNTGQTHCFDVLVALANNKILLLSTFLKLNQKTFCLINLNKVKLFKKCSFLLINLSCLWNKSYVIQCTVVNHFHDSTSKNERRRWRRRSYTSPFLGEVTRRQPRQHLSSQGTSCLSKQRHTWRHSTSFTCVRDQPSWGSSQYTDESSVILTGNFQRLTCLRFSVKQSQRPVGLVAAQSMLRNLLEEESHLLLAGEQQRSGLLAPELENWQSIKGYLYSNFHT